MKPINLDVLQKLSEEKGIVEISTTVLKENGLAGKSDVIKILGRGELTAKLTVTANKFSESAKQAIEKAGGTITVEE